MRVPIVPFLLCACAAPRAQDPPLDPAAPAPTALAVDPMVERAAIETVINDWHGAAAGADEARYLGHFSADAVFLGTDASERWTLEEFSAYVRLHFPRGGWTYQPHDRFVMLSDDGSLAWFDEQLTNKGYGELRGTGVLRRVQGSWKLAHYSMTFTVPNDVARTVVDTIKVWQAGGDRSR